MTEEHFNSKGGNIIRIDDGRIKKHLGEMVRSSVQEMLNALLDAEAEMAVQCIAI